jgi:hypothetical protein
MPHGPTTAQCRLIVRAMRGGVAADSIGKQGRTLLVLRTCLRRGWVAEATLPGFGLVYRATSAGIAAVPTASTLL